jgi:hypothetical protein
MLSSLTVLTRMTAKILLMKMRRMRIDFADRVL